MDQRLGTVAILSYIICWSFYLFFGASLSFAFSTVAWLESCSKSFVYDFLGLLGAFSFVGKILSEPLSCSGNFSAFPKFVLNPITCEWLSLIWTRRKTKEHAFVYTDNAFDTADTKLHHTRFLITKEGNRYFCIWRKKKVFSYRRE